MHLYFDASALIKRYVTEPGQAVLNELFRLVKVERLYLSYWTVTEAVSVLLDPETSDLSDLRQLFQAP